MTERHKHLLDLYTDYLLSSFGATTATGLSRLVPEVSHDQITRFLAQEPLSNKDLWRQVKAQVRQVQSQEGVLIIDDTVQEKPYSDESELITWHYDHSVGRTVKGINLLSALYFSGDTSIPVAFELIQKTQLETNTKTGKDKWVSPRSKNEMAREMIAQFVRKQIPFSYVLADSWFSCAENMCFIKQKAHAHFIFPLKSNRKVALSADDKAKGRWKALSSLDTQTHSCWTLHLESVPFPVRVSRHLLTNQQGQTGELFLCSSDVDLSGPTMLTIYQKRWKVEEYHKSLKQNAALAKSPTKLPHTQSNHIFASIIAFCKLEAYRSQTCLNHFALKAKLYQAALNSAFSQLQSLKAALPHPTA
jgi:SRSO17 transposase